MENMLTRIGIILIIILYLFNPVVKAEGENFKQCFYTITGDQNSKDIKKDLEELNDLGITIFVTINPNENIHRNIVNVLEKLQEEGKIFILLEDVEKLEASYFAVNEYGDKLKLSGLYNMEEDKLNYIGEMVISFDLIEISTDPINIISQTYIKKNANENYALIYDRSKANMSTLILAYNELSGVNLEVGDYIISLKEPNVIYRFFIYIGYITIIFFSVSIIILSTCIIIFKKWSNERFYYDE